MKLYFLLFLFILVAGNLPAVAAASCSCSCNTGDSCGTCSRNTPDNISHKSTIKQCVFKNLNFDGNSGQVKTCQFEKTKSSTSLRVTFQGVLRVIGCSSGCCRRWFITVNGKECSSPATIDTAIWINGGNNRHSPGTLDGFCDNIPQGKVTVGLSIGTCLSGTAGDAYTGWGTVSRFIIEEVPPLQ